MKIIKILFAIASIISISMAQSINISGIVKDSTDTGIEGATVKLENAGITDITLADGSFTLSGIPANNHYKKPGQLSDRTIFTLSNGQLQFFLNERSVVDVEVSKIQGSIIFSLRKEISEGFHGLYIPDNVTGINIYRVIIGNSVHIFKSVVLCKTPSLSTIVINKNTGLLSRQAKIKELIHDVIVVTKAGYSTYRMKVNNFDTSGVEIIMAPRSTTGSTITDIDGNVYNTVKIGNQEWTIENLRTTKYNDGTPIPLKKESSAWSEANGNLSPAYCYYKNKTSTAHREKYGALYNWYTVNTGKLAPKGWHVPTDADWTELEEYLIDNGYNWDGKNDGNKIAKSLASKTDWASSSDEGDIGTVPSKNNESNFSALPGGFRNYFGNFNSIGHYGDWWSATEYGAGGAWHRYLDYDYDGLGRHSNFRGWGFSVRLLRD